MLKGQESVASLCHRHGVAMSQAYRWRDAFPGARGSQFIARRFQEAVKARSAGSSIGSGMRLNGSMNRLAIRRRNNGWPFFRKHGTFRAERGKGVGRHPVGLPGPG